MSNILTNITKGFIKRVFKAQTPPPRFEKISWLLEKTLKHEEDTTIKQKTVNTLRIHYIRPYELLHTYKELFEKEIYHFQSSKPNPSIIDCGTNIGLSALYFKSIYPNSRIICFEPDSTNSQLLKQNIAVNKLDDVIVRNEAVWIKDGTIHFENKGSEASKINDSINTSSESTVACIDFSSVLNQYETIDFLKMDIEGAEYQVIKHCSTQLSKIQNMFIEYHGTVSETNKLYELLEIFHQQQFNVYIKNAADNLTKPFLQHSSESGIDVQLNIFCYRNTSSNG